MSDAYAVLGVDRTATSAEISAAFRAKSIECHPDKATDDADRAKRTAKMSRLTLAWRYLGDAEARGAYDQRLAGLEKAAREELPTSPDDIVDSFLGRLRAQDPGAMVAEFGRAAGLIDKAGFERVQATATKATEVSRGLVDLVGLIRGTKYRRKS